VLESPSARLKDIAGRLGITVQAVSQYVGAMRKEGLVRESKSGIRPTRKGMQRLQEHFSRLKKEVDGVVQKLSLIDKCVAIAGRDIAGGTPVALVMEDGMLMAYPNQDASSTGVALEPAVDGDDVLVGDLEGIVDMELGRLLLVEAPSEFDGGSKSADIIRARQSVDGFGPGLIVAGDLVGCALLSKTTPEFFMIHAPVESALSALSKGVDVVFCGTRDSVENMIEAVTTLKLQSGYEVEWRSVRV
jgi:predicted transcriptional regulator